jgi:UPF0042 nucleotide-binding protein
MTESADNETTQNGRVVLVTGLSGAGHTTALKALEDQDFEAVDNMPLRLLTTLLKEGPGPGRGLAIGIDARTRDFTVDAFVESLKDIKRNHAFSIEILFIDCDDEVLRRRFTETRRRHPLAGDRPVADGIARERILLTGLREHAEVIIDTSQLTPRDFGRQVSDLFAAGNRGLSVFVQSFAYRLGVPRDADLVFDMRFLRNPHYEPDLRAQTGLQPAVGAYIEGDTDLGPMKDDLARLLKRLLPRYAREGKSYLTIAFGCTGGRHRSVYMAESVAGLMREWGYSVATHHRELANRGDEDRIGAPESGGS